MMMMMMIAEGTQRCMHIYIVLRHGSSQSQLPKRTIRGEREAKGRSTASNQKRWPNLAKGSPSEERPNPIMEHGGCMSVAQVLAQGKNEMNPGGTRTYTLPMSLVGSAENPAAQLPARWMFFIILATPRLEGD
jgi:hypothetical protein